MKSFLSFVVVLLLSQTFAIQADAKNINVRDEKNSKKNTSISKAHEVYELVNIAIALTSYAKAKKDLVNQDSDYYQKICAWFDEYKDYRVVRDFDELLQKDNSAYSSLQADSYIYKFNGNDKLVVENKNVATNQTPSKLAQYIPQLEVFALSSKFRKFYKKNRGALFSANENNKQTSFQTLNIMDDFLKFWEQSETVDAPAQVKLFREMVINPYKEIFAGFTGEPNDKFLTLYLKEITPHVSKLQKVTEKLNKELPVQVARFMKTFPDMNWNGTIVFMPNYGVSDGGGGTIGGKPYLIFGVDTIVSLYGENTDFTVLFTHELFHNYFGKFHPELGKNREKGEIPLYWLVWNEGLATYASQRLNPGVTTQQIFLGQQIETGDTRKLPFLAKKVFDNFDDGNPDIWRPFMAAEKISEEIPPRSGYYVGYKIAEELGKKMSLKQLIQLKGEDLQKNMKAALKKLMTDSDGKKKR